MRASSVTTLYQAGVDTQRICSITKHKGEGTLTHYISSSTDQQKREASLILTSALDKDASNLTNKILIRYIKRKFQVNQFVSLPV